MLDRDPEEKDFSISRFMNTVKWTNLKKELDKCMLVCSRCHVEIHFGLIDGYLDLEEIF